MRILFIHPNFPAQFRHLAEELGKDSGNQVLFATETPRPEWEIQGVKKIVFKPASSHTEKNQILDPFIKSEKKGEAVLKLLVGLKKKGFIPDIIYGHSGWGSTWFVKDIFPEAKYMGYFEWYYNPDKTDMTPDENTPCSSSFLARTRLKNAVILNDLVEADIGISPTNWQKSQFPQVFQDKINVIHEGINTEYFRPDPEVVLKIKDNHLPPKTKLITYCARGLEPYRGFPQFMEALTMILKEAPMSQAVIVGSDRVCYGPPSDDGRSYRQKMLNDLDLDLSRIHFAGPLPYGEYLKVLQASTVHVYLTRPFILSWSMLEAMSCGCTLVASDTEPVREVITEGVNGFLTDFHRPEKIAEKVLSVLSFPSFMKEVKNKARKTIIEAYNVKEKLTKYKDVINNLTNITN